MISKIKPELAKFRFKLNKILGNAPNIKKQIKIPTERHGSVYGGWNIKKDSINRESIVYSFGIGKDITFDISLIKKYQVAIYAFDPTPEVKVWLTQQILPLEFNYYEVALADINGTLRFYSPENQNFVSYSLIKKNNNYIDVPCEKLSTIMKKLGHEHIDILKIDIEGAEFMVLKDILNENLKITQILVEFHHFFDNFSIKDTENAVLLMNKMGYEIFYISPNGYELSFYKF